MTSSGGVGREQTQACTRAAFGAGMGGVFRDDVLEAVQRLGPRR